MIVFKQPSDMIASEGCSVRKGESLVEPNAGPLTEELLVELLAAPDVERFVDDRKIGSCTLSECLNGLLEEKGLVRSEVIRAADLNETFGYQIFTGSRMASRNKVLQLAFAMDLDLREANRLLRAAGVNELYCKDRRDAVILFCLHKGCSLQGVNEELYRLGEDTIC